MSAVGRERLICDGYATSAPPSEADISLRRTKVMRPFTTNAPQQTASLFDHLASAAGKDPYGEYRNLQLGYAPNSTAPELPPMTSALSSRRQTRR